MKSTVGVGRIVLVTTIISALLPAPEVAAQIISEGRELAIRRALARERGAR